VTSTKHKKIIVIGIDGQDPTVTGQLMKNGDLPNFSRLAESGYYSPLRTINPPQSPVVWASIATGRNPGEHGIFDFIGRNPKNYLPNLAINHLGKMRYTPPVKAKTFWEHASDSGICSVILKWPLTFPPPRINGTMLAGLGVPDIKGGLGLYTFFTTDRGRSADAIKGRIVQMTALSGRIKTAIPGPVVASFKNKKETVLPLQIDINKGFIRCSAGSTVFNLAEGNWSEWIPLKFKLSFFRSVKGLCKFYLKSISPELDLYVSPIHVSFNSTAFPISSPAAYALQLSNKIGMYATLGLPEDTNALNDEILDDAAFISLCDSIMDERERMFFYELEKFRSGILACVFDTLDRIQHMFWRLHGDQAGRDASPFGDTIARYYKRMDAIIGRVLGMTTPDTALIICSDHGFCSFNRMVHLNTWLVQNGFMALKDGGNSSAPLFKNVDWSNTKAYALGLNTVYINIYGRERSGVVRSDEVGSVKAALRQGLAALTDGGVPVIKEVYDSSAIYTGRELQNAPDLIVGFERGYRASWQTPLGQAPSGPVIVDNTKKWSGDHCCDAAYVPGVIFSSEPSLFSDPSVLDIAPAICDYLGVRHT
jgi:predicted AlkP superfamily phosphohydrolase/phosphomutase